MKRNKILIILIVFSLILSNFVSANNIDTKLETTDTDIEMILLDETTHADILSQLKI